MGAEVIILTVMFGAIFGIVYVIVTARHRQRMAMIEKGLLEAPALSKGSSHIAFALGLLALALGLGIGIGWAIDENFFAHRGGEPAPYFISMLICCGSALVYFHNWRMKNAKK